MAKKANNNTQSSSNVDLGYLGIDFQHKLVKLFIEDSKFFMSINPIVDQNMFTEDVLRRIVGYIKDRYNESGLAPNYIDLELYIKTHVTDIIMLDTILATLNMLRDLDFIGQDIVKESADKFFKQQNLTKAINKAIEIVKMGDISKYNDIEDLIQKALNTNIMLDEGYNPMDDVDEALEENYRRVIPTGFSRLDKALYGGLGAGELGIIISPSGVGKAQPLTSRIVTPNGYTTMGEIKIGDEVIGQDGNPHKVIGVYPQGIRPVYRVDFSNGNSCECDENHLWSVNTYYQRTKKIYVKKSLRDGQSPKKIYSPDNSFKVWSLKDMIKRGIQKTTEKHNKKNVFKIPICKAVQFRHKDVDIDPYLLGYYIGDGCYQRQSITVGREDKDALYEILSPMLNDELNDVYYNDRKVWSFYLKGNARKKLREKLSEGTSESKYIPNEYLFNDINVRLSVLQGLMDSDGTVDKKGQCEFISKSKKLAEQVKWIVESFGGYATLREKKTSYKKNGAKVDCGLGYRVHFTVVDNTINPFRFVRKASKVKFRDKYKESIFITNVEYLRDDYTQCIMLDSEDHLYLTEDFIVTHNTSVTCGFAASAATFKCKDNNERGFKVLHIHFEDEDVNIKRKYYGWITGVDAIDLSKPEFKEKVKARLKSDLCEEARMIKENVWCYHLPSGEVTVSRIEQLIKQGIARGFRPDLIIIDYFECLEHDSGDMSDSEWTKEGKTMRKLEALAHKYDAAIWCPIQGTKDSFDKEILGLSSGGGSVKKVQIGHVILALARTQEQKKNHRVTLSLEKFRAGRMDDTVMPNIKFNNGTGRFEVDEAEDEALDFIAQQEDILMRRTREQAVDSVRKNRRNR